MMFYDFIAQNAVVIISFTNIDICALWRYMYMCMNARGKNLSDADIRRNSGLFLNNFIMCKIANFKNANLIS